MVATTRVVGDSVIIAGMGHQVSEIPQVELPRGTRLVEAFLGLWQRIALPVVRLLDRLG